MGILRGRRLFAVDRIAALGQESGGLLRGFFAVKLNFQNAFLKFAVVDDADIFDADLVGGQNRGDGGNGSGFVHNIAVQGKFFFDRSGGAVGNGIPVFS